MFLNQPPREVGALVRVSRESDLSLPGRMSSEASTDATTHIGVVSNTTILSQPERTFRVERRQRAAGSEGYWSTATRSGSRATVEDPRRPRRGSRVASYPRRALSTCLYTMVDNRIMGH